uniref:Secreted protein n=1 Tax=Steinernema glaseri TaxID=37863 RepID=A0A1I7ZGZ3_9BILA
MSSTKVILFLCLVLSVQICLSAPTERYDPRAKEGQIEKFIGMIWQFRDPQFLWDTVTSILEKIGTMAINAFLMYGRSVSRVTPTAMHPMH